MEKILGLFILPWVLVLIGFSFLPTPPRPEITYGEFPFRLEYEINDERHVIEDTLICKYGGIGMDTADGKFHKWKEKLASGNKRVTLLKISDNQEIYYPIGSARYYMGAYKGVKDKSDIYNASLYITLKKGYSAKLIYAEELLNKYNIRIINFEPAQPITNKNAGSTSYEKDL